MSPDEALSGDSVMAHDVGHASNRDRTAAGSFLPRGCGQGPDARRLWRSRRDAVHSGWCPFRRRSRQSFDGYANAHQTRGFSSWGLVERASGSLIGDVGFSIFEQTGDIELGYTLARPYWGHGYATEAAGACLAAGLAQLSPGRIIAVVDETNESSLRVAHRIGMRRVNMIEAYGRPHVVFAAE